MVKLQKRFSYTYKGKDHFKHVVTIPEGFIDKLGWKEGNDIQLNISKDKLVFKISKDEEK
jgi:hypothetical protein